jgi:hypothetical protein
MNANGVPNAPAIEVTPSRSLTLMFCVPHADTFVAAGAGSLSSLTSSNEI